MQPMNTPQQPQPQPAAGPGQLPGVVGWERMHYVDGVGQRTAVKVPINQFGELAGKPYACPKCKKTVWYSAATRNAPVCVTHPTKKMAPVRLKPPTVRQQFGDLTVGWLPPLWASVERPLRPVWALITAAGVAVIVDAADVPALPLLIAAPVAGYGAYRATRWAQVRAALTAKKLEHEDPDGDKRLRAAIDKASRTTGYATAGALTALSVIAALGMDLHTLPGWIALAAAGVAWVVPAATWWREERIRRNRPEPPPAPAAGPMPPRELTADELSAADAAKIWQTEVTEPGTALDEATWQRIACGWQAVIVARKRGALNRFGGELSAQAIKRIAAAFDVRKGAVTWIEEFDDSPNKALLLVQPNNPLAEGQIWGGPDTIDMAKGVAEAGRFIDGTRMYEKLYRFGWGAPSELVLGTTGGGKSERLRKRLTVERWASYIDADGVQRGAFISLLHDPKHMESYAELKRAIHGYGVTRDDAHLIVDALLRECFRRYDFLQSLPWSDSKGRDRDGGMPWNPLVHGPIISVYWDEFHELAGDAEFVKKLEKLARYQRACAMRGTIATHMATLGDTGSQALRDMLAGGRATLFRTTSGLTGTLATGGQLTADPRTIPKTPGMCLVSDGESASLMGRESYIPKDEVAEALGVRSYYDWWYDDDNNPIGFPAEIPAETAEAFGAEFMQWMAAGKRKGGRVNRPAGVPQPQEREQVTVRTDVRCVDAVASQLAASAAPMDVTALEDALFRAGTPFKVRTITGALGELVKQGVVFKSGRAYELTPQVRASIDGQLAAEWERATGEAEAA